MLKRPLATRAAVWVLVVIVAAVALAPWFCLRDPAEPNLGMRFSSPSPAFGLGTDHLGRDTLSRLLDGGRFSLSIAAVATVLTGLVGTAIGVLSARRGGWVDEFFTRTNDVLLALPEMVIALFIVAAAGPGTHSLLLALTVTGWTPFARLARTLTYEISGQGFLKAARVVGCSPQFIIFRHILPHLSGPLIGQATLRFGQLLISVGALSYLGLGVQPPQSDWGAMLAAAQPHAERAPLAILVPGLAIFIVALCVTLIGQRITELAGNRAITAPRTEEAHA